MRHPRVSTIELDLRKKAFGAPLRTSAVLRAKTAGALVAVLLSAVVAVAAAYADPYTVNSLTDAVDATPGDGICATAAAECTLRAAVQEANAHAGPDVITLPAGSYGLSVVGIDEDAAATGDLDVTDELQVNGAGAETTIISGLNEDRVFHVISTVFAIRDVTIRGGYLADENAGSSIGGGMLVQGGTACTVERVTFRDNSSTGGGGLAYLACALGGGCSSWALTITGSTFDANTSTGEGAAALLVGQAGVGTGQGVTIASSTFTGNVSDSTDSDAVSLSADAAFEITDTAFTNNATGSDTLDVGASAVSLSGCTLDGNSFGLNIFAMGPVSITDTTITNNNTTVTNDNDSFGGGTIYTTDAATISGGEVSDNGNGGRCGGLNVYASTGVTIDGTTFRRNEGGADGGALRAITLSGALSITNVEASDNSGLEGGGIAAVNADGDVVLTTVRVLDNGSGATPGGGLYATATGGIALTDSTVSGNVSDDDGGGAHVTAGGALSIQETTIAQNHAGGSGGGLVASGSTFAITNSTISGNVADGVAGGGGLSADGTGTIRNVTLVDNDAPAASAILNAGTLTVVSSIVAGNAANHCGGTAVTSGGSNLDSNGSCAFAASGDQNGVDPQLGPLADNGGPTLTHLPAAGSPVLDHGAAAGCPATDQRGETRPKDADSDGASVCDIGAVEAADGPDLCPNDPAKRSPGICGCGVADDAAMANDTPDCFINGELKARIARAKTIIGALTGDQDQTEAELNEIGGSFEPYLTQFDGQVVLNGKKKKVLKLAQKASMAIAKVAKAKAGKKLDKAKKPALKALDKFDAAIAPQG